MSHRDRFCTIVGVEVDGEMLQIQVAWNGGGWVPDLSEFRRVLREAAEAAYEEECGPEEDEDGWA